MPRGTNDRRRDIVSFPIVIHGRLQIQLRSLRSAPATSLSYPPYDLAALEAGEPAPRSLFKGLRAVVLALRLRAPP